MLENLKKIKDESLYKKDKKSYKLRAFSQTVPSYNHFQDFFQTVVL